MDTLDSTRIIPSVVTPPHLDHALRSSCMRINLLCGDINSLQATIGLLHAKGKKVFVHAEMIAGMNRDKAAIQFLADFCKADGVIATKSSLICAAKACGIPCVQRIFAIDSGALQTARKMLLTTQPDEVEMMPGLMPEVIRELKNTIHLPLIVGGLIKTPEAVRQAFASGADFVSTGAVILWV